MRMDTADKIVLGFVAQLECATAEHISDSSIRRLRDAIRDAIHQAVAAEREACAEIAASIRSRGLKGRRRERVEESPAPS